jgi:hypothetical protein
MSRSVLVGLEEHGECAVQAYFKSHHSARQSIHCDLVYWATHHDPIHSAHQSDHSELMYWPTHLDPIHSARQSIQSDLVYWATHHDPIHSAHASPTTHYCTGPLTTTLSTLRTPVRPL